jgi:FkbM family methyltransferase
MLKKIASHFPAGWQQELKRHYYAWQIRIGNFRTAEKEFHLLDSLLRPGDWAIDVGANVGHYTARMSRLVGHNGRVLAFEPVPKTFRLLAANARLFAYENVTLFNSAVSEQTALSGIEVPSVHSGAYLAHLTGCKTGLQVLCLALDSLLPPNRVSLVKVDAEGHELGVLKGMKKLLERDRPTLIVELGRHEPVEYLQYSGYRMERLPGSPNGVFCPIEGQNSNPVSSRAKVGQFVHDPS